MDTSMNADTTPSNNAPAPFLLKTFEMVTDPATNETVSWSECGNSFVVWNTVDFARDLLPQYFKHNNFSSFVRQLNTYGFRKVDPDRWEFANEGFSKEDKDALRNIHRKRSSVSQSQSVCRSLSHPEQSIGCNDPRHLRLEEEIKELKKEKVAFVSELRRFREQQQDTELEIQSLGEKLKGLEHSQQQMVEFLSRCMCNPAIFARFVQQNEGLVHVAKWRLPYEEIVTDTSKAMQSVVGRSPPDVDIPFGGFLKHLIISSLDQSGTNSHSSSVTLREMNAFGAHFDSSSTDASGQSPLDMTSVADAFVPISVIESDRVRDLCDNVGNDNIDLTNPLAPRDHTIAPNDMGWKVGRKSAFTSFRTDVCNVVHENLPHMSTKKPARTVPRPPSGVNDVFWENFLTESPHSTDTENSRDGDRSHEQQFL